MTYLGLCSSANLLVELDLLHALSPIGRTLIVDGWSISWVALNGPGPFRSLTPCPFDSLPSLC